MSYFVKWKPKPLNFISKLPKNIALRIWDKLDKLKENPFRYLKHFESEEIYKFRIGDYRALISIDFEKVSGNTPLETSKFVGFRA